MTDVEGQIDSRIREWQSENMIRSRQNLGDFNKYVVYRAIGDLKDPRLGAIIDYHKRYISRTTEAMKAGKLGELKILSQVLANVDRPASKRTIQRALSQLGKDGLIQRDKYGAYTVQKVQKKPVEMLGFNAHFFGRACLDLMLQDCLLGSKDFKRKLPDITQRFGILLTYLFIEALRPVPQSAALSTDERLKATELWIQAAIQETVWLFYFYNIIPEEEKRMLGSKKSGLSLDVSHVTHQQLVDAFAVRWPEYFEKLDHLRRHHMSGYTKEGLVSRGIKE